MAQPNQIERLTRCMLIVLLVIWLGLLFTWVNLSFFRAGKLWSINLTDGSVSMFVEPCTTKPGYIRTFGFKWRMPGMFGLTSPQWHIRQSPTPFFVAIQFPLLIVMCSLLATLIVMERRKRRDRTARCSRCHYLLIANRSGICPECGTVIPEVQRAQLGLVASKPKGTVEDIP